MTPAPAIPAPSPRVVVVTGASSGIGRAAAVRFGARGDRLVLVARREEALQRTLELAGGNGRTFVADVGDRAQVAALVASVGASEGTCHVLVNNAGVGSRLPFDGPAALDSLERVMAVNFFGAAYATAGFLPLLRATVAEGRGAAIVNVSSVAGLFGMPNSPIYCASKFALTGFSESLHAALGREGIFVANVQPGPVVTEGWQHAGVQASWLGRALVLADLDKVAATIVRAADGRGAPAPVVRRWLRWLLFVKVGAPPLYRALQRRARPGTHGAVASEDAA